jgi:hypothetical protein
VLERHLTTLFNDATAVPDVTPTKKRSLLPLLTFLFLVSYGLMTALIMFQGTTIQSQRSLILQLFDDSRQLWAIKGKALHNKEMAGSQHQGQNPSSQTVAPPAKTPSTQEVPRHKNQNHAGNTEKPEVHIPPQPAADLGDQRRVLISI